MVDASLALRNRAPWQPSRPREAICRKCTDPGDPDYMVECTTLGGPDNGKVEYECFACFFKGVSP